MVNQINQSTLLDYPIMSEILYHLTLILAVLFEHVSIKKSFLFLFFLPFEDIVLSQSLMFSHFLICILK